VLIKKLTTRGLSYSEGVPLEQTQANDEVFLVYWTLLRNLLLVRRPTTTWSAFKILYCGGYTLVAGPGRT